MKTMSLNSGPANRDIRVRRLADFVQQNHLCCESCLSVIPFWGVSALLWADIPQADPRTDIPEADIPWADTPRADSPPPVDGTCCGRYASYWNAFLFSDIFSLLLDVNGFLICRCVHYYLFSALPEEDV